MTGQGRTLDIPTPSAFRPLFPARRFKGARGGRGGAKSHFFGGLLIEEMFSQHTRAACVREVQKSIADSVKRLLEDKIAKYNLQRDFRITEREIICPRTESVAIFRGLQNHTATSIKSLEGFNRAWYEEAQSLSKRSLELAVPTFRTPGSEQWFSWNPDLPPRMQDGRLVGGDPVDMMFAENVERRSVGGREFGTRNPGEGDPDFACVDVQYFDNRWFPDDLRRDMERDRMRDPDKYAHIWLGGYRKNSEARVFKNFRVERFDTPANAQFYYGADWGMVDPTVLIRCFVIGRTLYIDREIYQVGCPIDRIPALFDKIDPTWSVTNVANMQWRSCVRSAVITADSARPETIDYMQKHGFPRMRASIKGAGSVEDGIEFLKSYDIVVHPDCRNTADEFSLFSHKMHPKTGEILNELEDKKNHTIDSARYAVENIRRATTFTSKAFGT